MVQQGDAEAANEQAEYINALAQSNSTLNEEQIRYFKEETDVSLKELGKVIRKKQ